jgi:putative PIN family toxin of toxin-antitoxin system
MVAALRSASGAGNAVLRLVAERRLVPVVTQALFLEYEEVIKRPEHRLVTGLSLAEVDRFLSALASACEGVDIHFRWRPQLPDPSDEMVLEAAINGHADAIITHNVRDFMPAVRRFGLRIMLPRELLKEIQ